MTSANYRNVAIAVGSMLVLALVFAGIMEYRNAGLTLGSVDKRDNVRVPYAPEAKNESNMETQQVTFKTNKGDITLELYTELMPITTENFIALARDGFYTNTKFHRVIDGFMIQGGDPNSKTSDTSSYGTGGPGYTITDEFVADERLSNQRGTIAMANTGQPNSGGSQFFINLGDNVGLDFDKEPLSSKHPVFGRVVDGMSVVDQIAVVETDARDVPLEPVVIEEVVVE